MMIMVDNREVSRQFIVDTLRRAGFEAAAEAAARELPDPMTHEQAAKVWRAARPLPRRRNRWHGRQSV